MKYLQNDGIIPCACDYNLTHFSDWNKTTSSTATWNIVHNEWRSLRHRWHISLQILAEWSNPSINLSQPIIKLCTNPYPLSQSAFIIWIVIPANDQSLPQTYPQRDRILFHFHIRHVNQMVFYLSHTLTNSNREARTRWSLCLSTPHTPFTKSCIQTKLFKPIYINIYWEPNQPIWDLRILILFHFHTHSFTK